MDAGRRRFLKAMLGLVGGLFFRTATTPAAEPAVMAVPPTVEEPLSPLEALWIRSRAATTTTESPAFGAAVEEIVRPYWRARWDGTGVAVQAAGLGADELMTPRHVMDVDGVEGDHRYRPERRFADQVESNLKDLAAHVAANGYAAVEDVRFYHVRHAFRFEHFMYVVGYRGA